MAYFPIKMPNFALHQHPNNPMTPLLIRPLREWVFFLALFSSIILMPLEAIKHLHAYPMEVVAAVLHLASALGIAYLFTVLVHGIGRAWVKKLLYVLPVWCVLLRTFLHFALKSELTPKVVMLVMETNRSEAAGFFSTFALSQGAFKSYVLTLLFVVLVVTGERNRIRWGRWLQNRLNDKVLSGILLTGLAALIYTGCALPALFRCRTTAEAEWWNIRYEGYSKDELSIMTYSLFVPHLMKHEIEEGIASNERASKQRARCLLRRETDSLTLVVVIGESYIKRHAQLYGYPLPTTPHMVAEQKGGQLLAFDRYISPYNFTTEAVKALLSCNDVSKRQNWSASPLFPVVFKQAGYTVEMWDNKFNPASSVFTEYTLSGFIYHPRIRPLAYHLVESSRGTLDGDLVWRGLRHATAHPQRLRLLLFHLNGQHFDAKDKYPDTPAFNVFAAKDVPQGGPWMTRAKRQQVAEYDNATRYNDDVMGTIFNTLRNKNAAVVYLSDHGEEIYDWRDQFGRATTPEDLPEYLHSMNDIPLVVWGSAAFIRSHPHLWHDLQQATARPGMSDALCHLLFRIAHIDTPYYIAQKDISSNSWKPTLRLVYNKWDYDQHTKE